jgi:hypothetical protein
MGMLYLVNILDGKKKWRLDRILTYPMYPNPQKIFEEGTVAHLVQGELHRQGEYWATRFLIISVDLFSGKYWGPYGIGRWNHMLDEFDVENLVHIHGFRKIVLGDEELKDDSLNSKRKTEFYNGLPFKEWPKIWEALNKLRAERIANRIEHPRKTRDQRFDDDQIDVFLARSIARVNAILNEELFWGIPADNEHHLRFHPQKASLEQISSGEEQED